MSRAALFSACSLLLLAAPLRAGLHWENPIQTFHRSPDAGHVETKFTFRNTGKTPVTIRRVKTSCGCTTAKPARETLAPGERGEITARFTFGSRKGAQTKVFTVETDDQSEPIYLNLFVTIHEPLTVTPTLVYWKNGETPVAKLVRLTVEPGTALRVKSVTSSNPRIIAKLEATKPGELYTLAVAPMDTAQKDSAEITVETDFPADQPRRYTIHARIK